MTIENEMKTELEKTDELLRTLASVKPKYREYPNYAHIGDVRRFNAMLAEIIEIFKHDADACDCGEPFIYQDFQCWSCYDDAEVR